MKSAELKLELITQIISTNDLATLMKIETILNNSDQSILEINEPTTDYIKTEKVYIFNEWQQKRIDIALKQVENGECISDEEAEKEIQIWFKEEEERLGGQ
jgi:predicted transcriptional regulator